MFGSKGYTFQAWVFFSFLWVGFLIGDKRNDRPSVLFLTAFFHGPFPQRYYYLPEKPNAGPPHPASVSRAARNFIPEFSKKSDEKRSADTPKPPV